MKYKERKRGLEKRGGRGRPAAAPPGGYTIVVELIPSILFFNQSSQKIETA
jgi:hypothetical protein